MQLEEMTTGDRGAVFAPGRRMLTRTRERNALGVLVAAAAALAPACIYEESLAELDLGEETHAIHEGQGIGLVGGALPSLRISLPSARDGLGVAFANAKVKKAYFKLVQSGTVYDRDDAGLLGATFDGMHAGGSVEVRITDACPHARPPSGWLPGRSEEHTSELQSPT